MYPWKSAQRKTQKKKGSCLPTFFYSLAVQAVSFWECKYTCITKSFRYLKWRVSCTLWGCFLGWVFPYISLTYSLSVLGTWNFWWIYINMYIPPKHSMETVTCMMELLWQIFLMEMFLWKTSSSRSRERKCADGWSSGLVTEDRGVLGGLVGEKHWGLADKNPGWVGGLIFCSGWLC